MDRAAGLPSSACTVAYHCIFLLGFQSGDDRVLAHSLPRLRLLRGAFADQGAGGIAACTAFPVWVLPDGGRAALSQSPDRRLVTQARSRFPSEPPRRPASLTPTPDYATAAMPASIRPSRPRRPRRRSSASRTSAGGRRDAPRQARVHQPGGSVKDRIGAPMIEAAERDGQLRPGGTIVEPTSGNTGVGSPSPPRSSGYRCVFVCPTRCRRRRSRCCAPTAPRWSSARPTVDARRPGRYYSVSDRLAEEIPGAFKPDQYSNQANPRGALRDDRPGDLGADRRRARRARLLGVGTGGTITGVARYLQERKPDVLDRRRRPRGLDLLAARHVHPYLSRASARTSGRPPTTRPSSTIRHRLGPRLLPPARRLAREEGLLVGGSGGRRLRRCSRCASASARRRHSSR